MSFPNIPDITPAIEIEKDQCVSMLLASVALEEMGLSHIINAEAEKIQYAVGTLGDLGLTSPATIDQVLAINDSACNALRNVIKNEMLLGMKMEDIIWLYGWEVYLNIVTVTAEFDGGTVTASDKAYYHTQGGAA